MPKRLIFLRERERDRERERELFGTRRKSQFLLRFKPNLSSHFWEVLPYNSESNRVCIHDTASGQALGDKNLSGNGLPFAMSKGRPLFFLALS